ncbi:membrane protein insertase YidC [bacterium]|nr:MAG: membrane protein insertase YidC [bacterium]
MEKRTLLAIALSILVLVAFSYFSPQQPVQRPAPPQKEQKEVKKERAPEKPPAVQAEIPVPPVAVAVEEKEIHIETTLYSAVFTTRGATIKQWDLKGYPGKNEKPVSLIGKQDALYPPLSIVLGDEPGKLLTKRTYRADKDFIKLDAQNSSESLTFSYSDPSGITIKKVLTFYRDDYNIDLATEVKGVESYKVVLGSDFGIFDKEGAWVHIGPVLLKDTDKVDIDKNNIEGISFFGKISGKKSRDKIRYTGNVRWIAQEDKYFAAALAPVETNYDAVIWSWEKSTDRTGAEIAYEVTGERGNFLFFAGPKQEEILKPFGVGLEHIIDFGFFSPIAKPIFWLLKLFYKVIGNYGWAIILITIVIRIPFIPLINKGQKSMKKLQVVQPQIAAMKEKYKNDPQRLQKETMELYKKHKVNPVGGCLPMVIQIPVFFALYKILLQAIEIRNAPFALWIHDLAVKDPYYILPILMGLTMVIQQKMTPSGMDPKQAKLMMMMPIVFTFMFLSFPAGLVLYWLVSNTLGIVQQYFVNKKAELPAK